jgi:hypothetical protein
MNLQLQLFRSPRRLLWLAIIAALPLQVYSAQPQAPSPQTPSPENPLPEPIAVKEEPAPADESPMMMYVVPWNTLADKAKNTKAVTLYKPWGEHFDPLTPAQTANLAASE